MDDLETLLNTALPLEEEEAVEDVGLTDDELQALCEEEYTNAKLSSDILEAQKLALQQYFLEPDGNEEEGSSGVQSSDVRDAVESALPVLMDMFLSSESPVIFRPTKEGDIDQAEQETAFCNYVLNTQNTGNLILLQWFKDALILKNGYVKVFWDARVNAEREDYQGISEDEYASLLSDDSYEVIQAEPVEVPTDMGPMPAFNVIGKRKEDAGQVRIVNIPNDRVRISANWNSIDFTDCPYICHEERVSRSDLVVDGFDPEMVLELPADDSEYEDDTSFARFRRDTSTKPVSTSSDHSRDTLVRYEHYIRADRNGDGIAELLKVTIIGGTGGKVIDVEEVDGHAIISTTPYVIPHSPYGMSLAEMMAETQKVKTAVLRQTLNNLYISNNTGLAVDVQNIMNPEALGESRAGMLLFKKSTAPVTEAVAVPFMADKSLTVMQAMDRMAEMKTGLSGETTGLDAETLAKSTNMVGAMTLNQAQLRMKLVMSTLCETGFKPLMLRIRALSMKNMSRTEMIELGGKWVEMEPRNWREKRNTQIRIGVGTVQKAERMVALQQIIGLQKEIIAQQGGVNGPFVTEANVYNTLSDVERMTGTVSVDRYFSNPANYTPPPPAPDMVTEAMQIEEAKVVVDASDKAAKNDLKKRELDIKAAQVGLAAEKQANDRIAANNNMIMGAVNAVA